MRKEGLPRLENTTLTKYDLYYLVYVYLYEALENAIKKYAKGKVLDIGCGNKPYLSIFQKHLSHFEYLGCDVIQSSSNNVDVLCLANEIPLESDTFDTVFSTQTIEHVFDHRGMTAEAYRLLKPGGHFIVSGPMYWPHHEEPYDFFRFTKYGFEELLKIVGFEVLEIIPNGGKWSLWGLATLHTFPKSIIYIKPVRYLLNSICHYLDKKHPDYSNTSNFVVIARKK